MQAKRVKELEAEIQKLKKENESLKNRIHSMLLQVPPDQRRDLLNGKSFTFACID